MGEGRNEKDAIYLEAERKAKKDTAVFIIVMSIIIFAVAIVLSFYAKAIILSIGMTFMWGIISMFIGVILYMNNKSQEIKKANLRIIEKYLSTEEFTKVILKNEYLIPKLIHIIKFYAIINKEDGLIEINIKIENNEEMRFITKYNKEEFINLFLIPNLEKEEEA